MNSNNGYLMVYLIPHVGKDLNFENKTKILRYNANTYVYRALHEYVKPEKHFGFGPSVFKYLKKYLYQEKESLIEQIKLFKTDTDLLEINSDKYVEILVADKAIKEVQESLDNIDALETIYKTISNASLLGEFVQPKYVQTQLNLFQVK